MRVLALIPLVACAAAPLEATRVMATPIKTPRPIRTPSLEGTAHPPGTVPAPTRSPLVVSRETLETPRDSVVAQIHAVFGADGAKAVRVARCESGLNPSVRSHTGRYGGLFQFDRRTWAGVGGSGDPAAASVQEQAQRAKALHTARGWSPWPVCGKR